MRRLTELSLFSGAGGGLLATQHLLGWRTLGYIEWDDYCQQVLAQRIADSHLDAAPIFGDINAFLSEGYAERYRGMVDIVTGGFPCQPFSVAGKQAGPDDPRNQWPATLRVIRAVRPRFAYLENVPGLLSNRYFGTILGDLAEIGYHARWTVLGADDVGAPHRRKRLWVLAHVEGGKPREQEARNRRKGFIGRGKVAWWDEDPADVGDADSNDSQTPRAREGQERPTGLPLRASKPPKRDEWPTQPLVGRVAHGVADRVDQLKALGNGQVPEVAALAWDILMERIVKGGARR